MSQQNILLNLLSKGRSSGFAKAFADERLRKFLLLIAVLLFTGGLYFALRSYPLSLSSIVYAPIAFSVFFLIPCVLFFNGLEFYISSKAIGVRLTLRDSVETIIMGSAANLLPIPGSAMAKMARLKGQGVSFKKGGALTLFLALIWLLLSLAYAGCWFIILDKPEIGWGLVGFSVTMLVLVGIMVRNYLGDTLSFLKLIAIRGAMVLMAALQTFLCFLALDFDPGFGEASIVSVSWVLGSTASIVPAGLGLSELFGAGLAALINIPASTAFLAVSLIRILNMVTIIPVSVLLMIARKGEAKNG